MKRPSAPAGMPGHFWPRRPPSQDGNDGPRADERVAGALAEQAMVSCPVTEGRKKTRHDDGFSPVAR